MDTRQLSHLVSAGVVPLDLIAFRPWFWFCFVSPPSLSARPRAAAPAFPMPQLSRHKSRNPVACGSLGAHQDTAIHRARAPLLPPMSPNPGTRLAPTLVKSEDRAASRSVLLPLGCNPCYNTIRYTGKRPARRLQEPSLCHESVLCAVRYREFAARRSQTARIRKPAHESFSGCSTRTKSLKADPIAHDKAITLSGRAESLQDETRPRYTSEVRRKAFPSQVSSGGAAC